MHVHSLNQYRDNLFCQRNFIRANVTNQTSLAEVFRALIHPYRRQLLIALLEHNPQDDDDRDPLNVVAAEHEPDVLETELVHNHLPMLQQQGYIEWDRDSGKISRGPNWDDIEPMIELLHRHRDELPEGWL